MIIDQAPSMDRVKTAFDDLCINNGRRLMDKRKHIDRDDEDDDDVDKKFKSKNLNAERRRRKKLSNRQLELRSLVPIITNMNKATIITDAITYIEELQKSVKELSDQLHQMEANPLEEEKMNFGDIDDEQETKKWGTITPEVQVIHMDGTKLWIKIIFQKNRGGISKLIEGMSVLGFELTDTSITTSRGAVLVTSSAEGKYDGRPDSERIKEFLLEIIRTI